MNGPGATVPTTSERKRELEVKPLVDLGLEDPFRVRLAFGDREAQPLTRWTPEGVWAGTAPGGIGLLVKTGRKRPPPGGPGDGGGRTSGAGQMGRRNAETKPASTASVAANDRRNVSRLIECSTIG